MFCILLPQNWVPSFVFCVRLSVCVCVCGATEGETNKCKITTKKTPCLFFHHPFLLYIVRYRTLLPPTAGTLSVVTTVSSSPATLYAREKRLWRGLEYETAPADGGRAAGGVTAAAATDASAVDDQSTSTQLALRPDGPVYDTRIHEGMAGRSVRYEVDGREM